MTARRSLSVAVAAASVVLMSLLAGCAPDAPTPTPSSTAAVSPSGSATPTASPTATASAAVPIPTDCRAILSDAVLAQLEGVPLNDPALGTSGVQSDGSLKCVWGDPGADTTGLTTVISHMRRGPALDMLNELMTTQGFTCYQPDEGTRCEKQWTNASHPVTDGRTLYWRADVLIDTTYSNLAPDGYTSSIVAELFG